MRYRYVDMYPVYVFVPNDLANHQTDMDLLLLGPGKVYILLGFL